MRRSVLGIGSFAAVAFAAPQVLASTFDARGALEFEPKAVVTESFETGEPAAGLTFKEGADALHGARYAFINTQQSTADVPLTVPGDKKSYRARFFARANRVVADVAVEYPAGSSAPSHAARFFPTGRVTSDGWYEVTTGRFSIDGTLKPTVSVQLFASGADVDAFELVEDGEFRAANRCALPRDPVCGAGEFCSAGFCRNGEALVPPLPQGADKDSVVSYLEGRLHNFFGGRITREVRLPIARETLAKMRAATDPWSFWNGYATAIHQLHDWHTKIDGPVDAGGRGAFPICFVEGDADLSHVLAPKDPGGLPDVLVSHTGADLNSGLKPGDRLVAINGVHPIAFAEGLDDVDWGAWRADDPQAHAEAVERLHILVRRWAQTLTFIRCDSTAKTCAAPVTINVSELPQEEPSRYPTCDHRPAYHITTPGLDEQTHRVRGVQHGLLRDSAPGEDIYGMVWNSVYLTDPAQNPYSAAIESFRASARGLVMDHRTGNGGTEPAAEYLTELFRTPERIGVSTSFVGTVGWFDAPFTREDGLSLYTHLEGRNGAFDVGAVNAKPELRTALLLARDGSASDWFPEGMKGASNVRIFGRRTAGAFSSFLQFDYYGGLSWQFASGDYIRKDGTTHIGEGVLPDEELVPKQSDLIVGRDTVYERALAWVRAGRTP